MMLNPRVLIVGAGPTGLVSAIFLAQNGISVRIIDKLPGPQVGQRGAALQPRIFELFDVLGVADDILKEAAPLQPPLHHNIRPGPRLMVPTSIPWYAEPSPDIPYPTFLILGQDRTEAILRAHLETHYHIRVHYKTNLVAFEQNGNSVTTHLVETDRNGHSTEQHLTVGWLVGADGPRSTVRKLAGLTFPGETRDDQKFITGEVHVQSGLNRQFSHRWGDFIAKGIGLRPSGHQNDTSFSFIVGGSEVPHTELMSNHEALLDYIMETTGRKNLVFGELVHVEDWRPNIRMANKFYDNRVFIAGDAAHVHCTSGGQGIVSCVQDAMNLCWKLALVERGVSSPTLLSTYDEERRPVIEDMLSITTTTFDQIVMDNVAAWPKAVSDLRQFGVNYRWSSIIVDDKPDADPIGTYDATLGKPQAGDRAPEAPGLVDARSTKTTTVFEVLVSFRHTVLVFTDTVEEAVPFVNDLKRAPAGMFRWAIILPRYTVVSSQVAESVEGLLLIDYDNYAHRHYLPDESRKVVFIRPDGVIGAMTSSSIGLQRYLSLICIA